MATAFDERLRAPIWLWVAVLAIATTSAITLHGGATGVRAVVPYVVLLPVAVAGLLTVSRGRVQLTGGVLHVPGARIAVDRLGAVTPLSREGTRRMRGPLAEPRALVVTRAWLTRAVRIDLDDALDDTPYWLVGTRHPERLAAALAEALTEASAGRTGRTPPPAGGVP